MRFPHFHTLAIVLLSTACRVATASPAPPVHWTPDGETLGIYEFRSQGKSDGTIPNLIEGGPSMKLNGKWETVSTPELGPQFFEAGNIIPLDSSKRTEGIIDSIGIEPRSSFSIDILLRWNRTGGRVLRLGTSEKTGLVLGMRYRGPGELELQVPIRMPDGSLKKEVLDSSELFQAGGIDPIQFERFYTYSLAFDGKKNFSVLLDGVRIFEREIAEGEVALDPSSLAVGDVSNWTTRFSGEIAGVRVSKGIRKYDPPQSPDVVFSSAAKLEWRFDAGSSDSPLAARAIRLTSEDLYSAGKGYGWIQKPKNTFDSWYSPARFDYEPKKALESGTYKIHTALARDGVISQPGDIFRADIPNGSYWVTVGLGDSLGQADVASVSANGVVLGTDLRMKGNIYNGNIPHRLARGLVGVTDGNFVLSGISKDGIPVQSISILPYVPLPIVWKDAKLHWQASGVPPLALDPITALLVQNELPAAVELASAATDPLIRANLFACILGYPHYPGKADLLLARQLRQLLLQILRQEPTNVTASWLLDSTERYRHVLVGYLEELGDEVVYGSKGAVRYQAANQGLAMRPEDPEYWQGRFLAAASLWQNGIQSNAFGATSDEYVELKKNRLQGFGAPGRYFREIIETWPDFRIARIMLGEKLPLPSSWQAPQNAPEWATLQYRLMHRILDVLHYWVEERMTPGGLLGGGLGDDVEALRWWAPAITLADDKIAASGWRRLADAAWDSTGGKGFALKLQDVEHSAEDISDSQPFLSLLSFGTVDSADVQKRLTKIQPVFRDIWTTVTPNGYRMFKGHFLNASEVAREGDVPYNIRAIRPLLWAAWSSNESNKELDELLIAYARSWRDATMTEFDGKPKGIVPMMIMTDRLRAKKENGDGHLKTSTSWFFPGYWNYQYPRGYAEKVYDLFLAGYELSGDPSFLEPIRFGLEAFRRIPESDEGADRYPEGSLDWALRIGAPMIGVAGANYRILTGDQSYDDVLLRIAPSYSRFTILAGRAKTADALATAQKPVIEKLKIDLAEMDTNPELRTTIIESTDRIFVKGSLIIDAMATGLATPDADLRGGEIIWPNYQITWQGTQGEVAALVLAATPAGLKVNLYNFAAEALELSARLWRLKPGTYRLTLHKTDRVGFAPEQQLDSQVITIGAAGDKVSFIAPSQTPLQLELSRQPASAAEAR